MYTITQWYTFNTLDFSDRKVYEICYVMLHAVSLTLVKTSITLYECSCS